MRSGTQRQSGAFRRRARAAVLAAVLGLMAVLTACSEGEEILGLLPDLGPDSAPPAATEAPALPTEPPVILAQPEAQIAPVGTELVLSVQAGGEALRYCWQLRQNAESEWIDCRGAGSDSAEMKLLLRGYHEGYQLRCVISNAAGEAVSEPVTVHLSARPEITLQPHDCVCAGGESAAFYLEAVGGDLSYQWVTRSSARDSGKPCQGEGSRSPSYCFEPRASQNGHQFRCEVRNELGTACSDIVTLTVN